MFRRSIQILLATTLLALVAIVAYASFLEGAPETLARAERMVERREFARAIKELNQCERGRSLQQDPALRERLWRLRLAANTAIGNHRGALRDVTHLLRETGDRDLDLQLERIRLLGASGDGEAALRLARAFVAEHPEHGPGLEVAAATCADLYRATFDRQQQALLGDLGAKQAPAARAAMATFVFRPGGDEAIAPTETKLADMYSVDTRLAARWPVVQRDLLALREQVQEGLDYCRRCLELPGAPSTAATTWAEALDAGGRYDDMLVACEIQRRRAEAGQASAAGLVAARSLLRRGANGACVATVGRWLPPQQLAARIDEGRLGDAAPDLLLARMVAGWRLGDMSVLLATLTDVQQLRRSGVTMPLVQFATAGLLHYHAQSQRRSDDDVRNSEANLRITARQLLDEPAAADRADLLALVMPIYIELIQKLDKPESDVLNAYGAWQKARPDALAPRVAFVHHLLGQGQVAAAQSVLAEAIAVAPTDEHLFALRLQVARTDTGQAGQDGPALLAQCLKRQSPTPEVAQPIGYVLCAETALQQRIWGVARESARLAADAFPQLATPRLLEIEAMLGGGEVTAAAQRARRMLDLFPGDAALARVALRSHRAAGLPSTDLLARALPLCAPDEELRAELLRTALALDPAGAAAFAAPVGLQQDTGADLRLLAARALCRAGRVADGRHLLDGVLAESDALPAEARLDLTRAITAWIVADAAQRDDAALAADVAGMLARTDLRDPAAARILLDAAAQIAPTHPRCGYELVGRGLDLAAPADRNGAAFGLAGRLARHLHLERLAEEHLLAALAFPDGRSAAEDLARLHLAHGRPERAVQVHAMVDSATDAALAARCGQTETGIDLATDAANADPADLVAQATLTALGKPGRGDWQAGDVPLTELRLELLALLQEPDLGPEALARAEALLRLQPSSLVNVLLLARAHRLAGDAATAAAVHDAVAAQAPDALLWREVALAAAAEDYVLSPALRQRLVDALLRGALDGSPVSTACALQCLAEDSDRDGRTQMARAAREQRWVHYPLATVTTVADVEAVVAEQAGGTAAHVLERALPGLTGAARTLARTHLYDLYDRRVADYGERAQDVYQTALRHLGSEGPHGCIVTFLLEHGPTFPGLRPDADTARQLLRAQIELAAAGRDPGPWLPSSVRRLLEEQGPAATREDLEAVLARHPTHLALWHARAVVMVHEQRAEQGIDELRSVLRHADAPEAVLAFLLLAGAQGVLLDTDYDWLTALPASLRDSVEGTFVRGLLALRQGRPDEAVPLLAESPPQADGMHLFALALAHLQSRALEGGDRARAVFERLAADYPSSSLARNAGSFAIQLAPR